MPDLIEFWQQCPFDKPPFVHPDDQCLLRDAGRLIPADANDFKSYIDGPRFANADDNELHLSLLPVPYAGNLLKAKIVILLLNPAFSYGDYWAEYHGPGFRDRVIANLHQSFDGDPFPFMFLDPQFCWNGGFIWWEKKLRKVVKIIADRKCKGNYRNALQSLSSKLACVELFPYHSATFGDRGLLGELPSVKAARHFVRDTLIPQAKDGKQTVIVTRQVKAWKVERWKVRKRDRTVIRYDRGHAQGASLGPNSKGGKAILKHYGI